MTALSVAKNTHKNAVYWFKLAVDKGGGLSSTAVGWIPKCTTAEFGGKKPEASLYRGV